ncbi:hypothetical protein [Guptibacillus algicola]|uniref:hypothetical protein n=1 Tax=Guptibacillus algicola TaxID=225844 RepID=UPI001CD5C32A|nr:hypothetical protein [Alkalihalobacillus algicola]MCA0986468.1 hypothetical protein [Alkalihalobacillus algicola]
MKKLGLPIGAGLVILLFVFLHQLNLIQQQPDENWSRTMELGLSVEDNEVFVANEEDSTDIYISGDPARKLNVTTELEVSSQELQYNIPEGYSFFIDDEQAIFKENDQLIHSKAGTETPILDGIEGINTTATGIVSWSKHKLYFVSPDGEIKNEVTFDQEEQVKSAVVTEEDNVILYALTGTMNRIYYVNPEKAPELIMETKIVAGDYYSNFQAVEKEETTAFTYTIFATRNGSKLINTYYAESSGEGVVEPKLLKINNPETGNTFSKPSYFSLGIEDGEPTLLFSANDLISPKKSVISIYQAKKNEDGWVASRRSTSEELSIRPIALNGDAIVWLDKEKSGFELHGASTSNSVVEESTKTTGGDIKFALFDTFSAIVGMFAMLAFSFGFLILPAFALMYLYFSNTTALERDKRWVEWTIVTLFVGSQIAFLPSILDGPFQYLAPNYLTFSGAGYVWPLLIFVFSYMISRLGQDNEWTILQKTSYQLGINLGIVVLLLGPYIL